MNQDWLVLLVCLAVIVTLAALLYAAGRAYMAAITTIGDLRSSLDKVHREAEEIRHSIQLQRPVLYDAHRRISAVTKALQKGAH
jgi:hypothetical protein